MNAYVTDRIRNVGIVGHGDTGKTQLVSSLLFTAGMTPRLGKVAEGTTITDWDEEEIARKITIHTGVAHAEWRPASQSEKIKINFLDTPGYSTFINETKASLVAADAALVLVGCRRGRAGGHRKSVELCGRVQLAASDRAQLDGPRPGRFRSRDGIAAERVWAGRCRAANADRARARVPRRGRSDLHEGLLLRARRQRRSEGRGNSAGARRRRQARARSAG